ncbi:MAG: biopolymer transporter ExbD, partial [Phaeodactylibacter sp.]|nr:biopolymer transporter ExbD [Phaeodactylibacter sp.]
MGLKKRSKVSAEFSMSSLTDIIFLLLIFFMLTSSLVAPNALNLKLPSSSKTSTPSTNKIDDVRISQGGNYYLNNRSISLEGLESEM